MPSTPSNVESAANGFVSMLLTALEPGRRKGRIALSGGGGADTPWPASIPASDFLELLPDYLPAHEADAINKRFRKGRLVTDPATRELLGKNARFWWLHFAVWSRQELQPDGPEHLRYVLDAYMLLGRSGGVFSKSATFEHALEIINTSAEIHHYYRSDRKHRGRDFSRGALEDFAAETLLPRLMADRSKLGTIPPFGVGVTLVDGPSSRVLVLALPPLNALWDFDVR